VDPFGLSGKGIEEPSFWENFIPIWGSGKAAAFYFQNGQWAWGTINTGLAITDVFLVKAIFTAMAKSVCKGVTKAGAGGNWPVIGEVIDSKVIKQIDSLSCGAACGEMVLKDLGIDVLLGQLPKGLTDINSLARALNKVSPGIKWLGNFVDPSDFVALTKRGSWVAMMWNKGNRVGHWVVVDGVDDLGQVLIRDPWNGTKYSMKFEDFLETWSFGAVYR